MTHNHYMFIAVVAGLAVGFWVTSISSSGPLLTVYAYGNQQTMF